MKVVLRAFSLLLFLGSWLSSWKTMVINGVSFFGGDMSAPTALPFFVCVAGFCITNVRGCSKFMKKGKAARAVSAILDVDVPHMILMEGANFCKDEPCEDLKAVRLRQGVWRSLPLGVVSLLLVSLNVFEIPLCQLLAVHVVLAGRGDLLQELNQQPWQQSWARMVKARAVDTSTFRRHVRPIDVLEDVLAGVRRWHEDIETMWNSSHCLSSCWFETRGSVGQMLEENVLLPAVSFHNSGVVGPELGSGNLRALNLYLGEQQVKQASLPLKVHWDTLGRQMKARADQMRSGNMPPSLAAVLPLVQWRPWRFQWAYAMSMLLAAALPIQSKIMERRELETWKVKVLLAIYSFADLACLAGMLITTAMSSQMLGLDTVITQMRRQEEAQRRMADSEAEAWAASFRMATLSGLHAFWPLILTAGFFSGATLLLSLFCFPELSLGQAFSASPCSPLYLLCFDRVSARKGFQTMYLLVILRSVLLTVPLLMILLSVPSSSFKLWSALVFNYALPMSGMVVVVASMFASTTSFGVAALFAIENELESTMLPVAPAGYGSIGALAPPSDHVSKSQPLTLPEAAPAS